MAQKINKTLVLLIELAFRKVPRALLLFGTKKCLFRPHIPFSVRPQTHCVIAAIRRLKQDLDWGVYLADMMWHWNNCMLSMMGILISLGKQRLCSPSVSGALILKRTELRKHGACGCSIGSQPLPATHRCANGNLHVALFDLCVILSCAWLF